MVLYKETLFVQLKSSDTWTCLVSSERTANVMEDAVRGRPTTPLPHSWAQHQGPWNLGKASPYSHTAAHVVAVLGSYKHHLRVGSLLSNGMTTMPYSVA